MTSTCTLHFNTVVTTTQEQGNEEAKNFFQTKTLFKQNSGIAGDVEKHMKTIRPDKEAGKHRA